MPAGNTEKIINNISIRVAKKCYSSSQPTEKLSDKLCLPHKYDCYINILTRSRHQKLVVSLQIAP